MIKSNGSDYFKREFCFFGFWVWFWFAFFFLGSEGKDGNGRVGFEQRVGFGFGFGFGVKNEKKLDMWEIGERKVWCARLGFFLKHILGTRSVGVTHGKKWKRL